MDFLLQKLLVLGGGEEHLHAAPLELRLLFHRCAGKSFRKSAYADKTNAAAVKAMLPYA